MQAIIRWSAIRNVLSACICKLYATILYNCKACFNAQVELKWMDPHALLKSVQSQKNIGMYFLCRTQFRQ